MPNHACFTFHPASQGYSNVTSDQTSQNYMPTRISGPGCAEIDVTIGGTLQGTYGSPSRGSQRVTWALDTGPVKVDGTNSVPIIAAIRDAWLVNGKVTSFVQMMGLPREALSTTSWFPAYKNVTISGQLHVK
jgi:hypothetical protein